VAVPAGNHGVELFNNADAVSDFVLCLELKSGGKEGE